MSEDIKEILDKIKYIVDNPTYQDVYYEEYPNYITLDSDESKLLLDYITNLQERINKAIEYIKEDMYVEPKELYGLVDGEHLLNILKGEISNMKVGSNDE